MNYIELKEYLLKQVEQSESNHGCVYTVRFPQDVIDSIHNNVQQLSDQKYSIQQKIHWIINDFSDFPKCQYCGKALEDPHYFRSINCGYAKCCSSRCIQKTKDTKEKIIQTVCKNTNETSENITNIFQLESIKQKICDFWTNKYGEGIINPGQVFNRRTGYESYLQNMFAQPLFTYEEYNEMCNKVDRYHNKHLRWRCLQCGYIFESNVRTKRIKIDGIHKSNIICPKCIRYRGSSIGERVVLDYVRQIYNGEIQHDNRKILLKEYHSDWNGNREIDIWLPDIKLAIEYNGTYFHCDPRFYNADFLRKDIYAKDIWRKDKQKIDVMTEIGIQSIVIWEYDWKTKPNEIKSIIMNKINELTDINYERTN